MSSPLRSSAAATARFFWCSRPLRRRCFSRRDGVSSQTTSFTALDISQRWLHEASPPVRSSSATATPSLPTAVDDASVGTKRSTTAVALLQHLVETSVLPGVKFAVVYCGNHQYKVSPGDVVIVQRLRAEIGSQIRLQKVLMVGGARFTAIGRPLLEGVVVKADVEEQKRMRNVVSLFSTPGRRRVRWVDAPHAATVLRIRSVEYYPEVVGELDKYEGTLVDHEAKAAAATAAPSPEEMNEYHGVQVRKALLESVKQAVNPVYDARSGYQIFQRYSTDAMENAKPMPHSVLGPMEELMLRGVEKDDAEEPSP